MRRVFVASTSLVALAFGVAHSRSMPVASALYIGYASIANAAATVLPFAIVSRVCQRLPSTRARADLHDQAG